jgi:hypothetical protein
MSDVGEPALTADEEAIAAYDWLRADEGEWRSYRDEARLTDNAASDWLSARAEDLA